VQRSPRRFSAKAVLTRIASRARPPRSRRVPPVKDHDVSVRVATGGEVADARVPGSRRMVRVECVDFISVPSRSETVARATCPYRVFTVPGTVKTANLEQSRFASPSRRSPAQPTHGSRSSAASKSSRVCTGSPCDTNTRSNGRASIACNAGSTRASSQGDAHTQRPVRRRHAVGEDERALLRSVDRCLQTPAAVVEGAQAARQRVVGVDGLELRLRRIAGRVEVRAVPLRAVPTDEQVDVANVVGLEHDDRGRRCPFEP
jgi:hypothetical protein